MARKRKMNPEDMRTRIIRASNDSSRDYYLPLWRAQELFAQGKLVQLATSSRGWEYATREQDGVTRHE